LKGLPSHETGGDDLRYGEYPVQKRPHDCVYFEAHIKESWLMPAATAPGLFKFTMNDMPSVSIR
jgi:hypothetical protein